MSAKLAIAFAIALAPSAASAQFKLPKPPNIPDGGLSAAAKKARDDTAKAAQKARDDTAKAAQKAKDDTAKAAQKAKDDTAKAAQKARDDTAKAAQKAKDDTSRELKSAGRVISDEAKKLGGDTAAASKKMVGKGVAWLKSTPLYKYVTDRALALFMESPRPIRIDADSAGVKLGGEPVYYVNGMFTSRQSAVIEATELATRVRRPVRLILNPSVVDGGTGTPTTADDLSEAVYDREWPANFATMNVSGFVPALKTPNPPFAQLNPTTRQLTHLLYHNRGRLDIVSHSQGCIQMRNALLAAGSLGKESAIRGGVAWVATGTPVNDNEVWPRPGKYHYLINSTDPVPVLIGVRGGPNKLDAATFKNPRHQPIENYFPKVTPAMLYGGFGEGSPATGPVAKPDPAGRPPSGDKPADASSTVTLVNRLSSAVTFEVAARPKLAAPKLGGFRPPAVPSPPPVYQKVTLAPKASRAFAVPGTRLQVRYAPGGQPPRVDQLDPGTRHEFRPLAGSAYGLVRAGAPPTR